MKSQVLFNWQPLIPDEASLVEQFTCLVKSQGFTSVVVSTRGPECNRTLSPRNPIFEWHPDFSVPGHKIEYFVVWSNEQPTEVQFADGTLLQAEDGDVILVNNNEDRHRAPRNQLNRWFARAVVTLPVLPEVEAHG